MAHVCPFMCMSHITQANSSKWKFEKWNISNYKTTMSPHKLQKTTGQFILRSYENLQLLINTETENIRWLWALGTINKHQCLWGCVHKCAGAYVVAKEGWQLSSAVLLIFWDKVSHWTQSLPSWLDWLAIEVAGSTCLFPPPPKMLKIQASLTMAGFYVGTGDSSSGLHVYISSTPTQWAISSVPNSFVMPYSTPVVLAF